MGWRVVYIEESDLLTLYLDNIKIKTSVDEITIPIKDIHTLILDNYKTVLSVQLINMCAQENVNLLFCGIDHMPKSLVVPYCGHYKGASMLKKQLSWGNEFKEYLHKEIVKTKITNQASLLQYHKKSSTVVTKIEQFKDEVVSGDKTNREGLAAKMYFRELYGENFKRGENDTVNLGLNYGYSIIRSQITKSLIAKGLNTSLGIFHHGPSNFFNLSDDIIEPFRPIVDNWVYKNLLDAVIFKREHRIELIKLPVHTNVYLENSQTFFNTVDLYIESILTFIELGDISKLKYPQLIF